MRAIGDGLRNHLAGTATTLCRCWRVERRDGMVLGFTDHDRDLEFTGMVYEAQSGLSSGDMEASLGLNADSQEVSGALSSERISEEDILADRYDGARVEVFLVNWLEPGERMLERTLTIGEVVREDGAFRAELRGASAVLDQTRGRRFQRSCDADLGDARCRFDLSAQGWSGQGTIALVRNTLTFETADLDGFVSGHFRGGRITFTNGRNAGLSVEVAGHGSEGGTSVVTLWKPAQLPLVPGDGFIVRPGCDKTFATCRDRFANEANFRGFPHIPGNDFTLGAVTSFSIFDGTPLVP